jgi:sulfate adenylyltransferase subunit 1
LRVKEIVVAINKMDLVDYSEEVYNKIKADQALNAKKHVQRTKPELHSLAAINGGNVVENQQICLGMMG